MSLLSIHFKLCDECLCCFHFEHGVMHVSLHHSKYKVMDKFVFTFENSVYSFLKTVCIHFKHCDEC